MPSGFPFPLVENYPQTQLDTFIGWCSEKNKGGWKTQGTGKHTIKPLPKNGFGPPHLWYVFPPPFVFPLLFSLQETSTDQANPTFWGLQNWFWRAHSMVRFPPKKSHDTFCTPISRFPMMRSFRPNMPRETPEIIYIDDVLEPKQAIWHYVIRWPLAKFARWGCSQSELKVTSVSFSSQWRRCVQFSVTKFKPMFLGENWQKICHQKPTTFFTPSIQQFITLNFWHRSRVKIGGSKLQRVFFHIRWCHDGCCYAGTTAERNCPRTILIWHEKRFEKREKKDPKNDPKRVRKMLSPSQAI